ncbi:MAG: HAMP domain-containing histidine kinase [Desulfobulbaceae bacterium]|nr:HAMP domain-containing histidine kinase [Desulfobulbaceae bacterium]
MTNKKNDSELNVDWKDFFHSIEEYIDFKSQSSTVHEILNKGIKVFLQLPCAQSVALFLISSNDFSLNFKISSPASSENLFRKIADYAIETSLVGEVLSTGTMLEHYLGDNFSEAENLLLIPLKTSRTINGLIFVLTSAPIADINQILYRFNVLFVSMFASDIQSLQTYRDLEVSKSILEQKVHARTIDLKQSQRELRTVIDSVLTGILIVDNQNKKIIQSNPIAQDLIGHNELILSNRFVSDFLPENPEFINDNNKISKQSGMFESYLLNSSNIKIPILRTATQIKSGLRDIIIESFVDISARKKLEESLQNANEILELKVSERTEDLQILVNKLKLEISERETIEQELRRLFIKEKELGEMKMRFVNMVSHEFRTPLTVIRTSSQLIDSYYERFTVEQIKKQIEKIIYSVDSLTALLDNTVFIGKSEADKLDLNLQEVNLQNFFDNLIKDIKQTYTTGHKFNLSVSTDIDFILSDPKLLWHIFNNLIINAIKYSHQDSEIIIRASVSHDAILCEVRDFGIGIPQEELNHIFDMFFRAKNVGITPGTGLGLSVVNESVKKLGGQITVRSSQEYGTSFKVNLPFLTAD